MLNENDIRDVLKTIIDPDFKKDIVSLGFVKNIQLDTPRVSLDIELTTPACPVKSEFQRQAESLLLGLPGITEAKVNMTAQKRPAHTFQIKDSGLKDVKSIIAISSCKGGVGKSTVAAHIARDLTHKGFKVGLLDADIFGPSIPTLFELHNIELFMTPQKKIIPQDKDGLKIMSFGFMTGDAPAVMRGPIVTQYTQQLLHHVHWGDLDYLFIDMPPGTGDIHLTITQSASLDGAIIVTTPHTLSIVDVAKGIMMFEKVNVPILGVIENMATFTCPDTQKSYAIFGDTNTNPLEKRFGIETIIKLPIVPSRGGGIAASLTQEIVSTMTDRVVMAIGKNRIQRKNTPNIYFDKEHIRLSWEDGETIDISNLDLRLSCQCALCVNEMTGKQILQKKDIRKDICAEDVQALGNYAISVKWNDGHNSGIYPYKSIRS